jgi:predicted ATPase
VRDVSIDLERFTVFVGANGSGKTSVLEAIYTAVRAASGNPQRVFVGEHHGDRVYTQGGEGELSIRCETDGGSFSVEATPPNECPGATKLQRTRWKYRVHPAGEPLDRALESVRSILFPDLGAGVLTRPSYSRHDQRRMQPLREELAPVLAEMALDDPEGFRAFVDEARKCIPRLRQIRFRRQKRYKIEHERVREGGDVVQRWTRRPYIGEVILFDFEDAENVSADAAGIGTVEVLGFLTVLLGPVRPSVLLLDEIGLHLHPVIQRQLIGVIEHSLERHPRFQLITTSHSPYLLNYAAPEQVRIMVTNPDGHSRCGRLTDHPQFVRWKEEMAPGEMWSVFGEKWVVEQGAT